MGPHRLGESVRYKYVTTFSGRRDNYETAAALAEVDRLEQLVTDFYLPDTLKPVAALLPCRLREKVVMRSRREIPSRLVRNAIGSMLLFRASKFFGGSKSSARANVQSLLGRRAARRALGRGAGALVYSYNWLGFCATMNESDKHAGPKVLFQVHPVPSQVRQILAAQRVHSRLPRVLDIEEEMPASQVEAYDKSLLRADGVIAPSSFVKRGLVQAGVEAKRIHVVPYGTKGLKVEHNKRTGKNDARRLRLLWVGQLVYRKGAETLFDAIKRLPEDTYSLTMVCREIPEKSLLDQAPTSARILRRLSETDLQHLYASSDLLVMPSLIEGFGLVYLEAMAAGMGIICTGNTGGPDVMSTGKEGVIVSPGNVDELASILADLTHDRERIEEMKRHAKRAAALFDWERFREGLRQALVSIEESHVSKWGR